MTFRRAKIAAAVLAFVAVFSFPAASLAQESPGAVWPTKVWEFSTPEEQGMDSKVLARLIDDVGTFRQDSVLVIRHGKIVADAYYAPYVPGIRHDLRSVTKSFMSTLIGVLVQQGKLESVDRPVLDFFADKTIANLDDRKKAITVQHLLDMASGIAWVERGYTPDETIMQMYASLDPTQFVLDQPMSDTPGEKFNYKGGDPYLLSALTNKLTGQNALEFARTELLAPLGITDVRWAPIDKQGVVTGEAGMFVTPHDMAKLGYLYLRDGVWDGKRIIPSAWVERTKKGAVATASGKYANLWWTMPNAGAFVALGRHGQLIVVLPKLDIVAVMTGMVADSDLRYPVTAVVDQLVNAVKSDKPLPTNADGEALLNESIRNAATEKPTRIWPAPELAQTISGKTWRFDDNKLLVRTLRLNLTAAEPIFEFTVYSEKENSRNTILSEPIGLDGVSRGKRQTFAHIANKGTWLDSRTFQVERRFLGQGQIYYWQLQFEGEKLKLGFRSTDGWSVQLLGEPVN